MSSNAISLREVRKFGAVAFVFFGCLCALSFWRGKQIPVYFLGTLSLLGLGFILAPGPLQPVHAAWIRAARFFGRIVNVVALSLAYYLVITPSALLKRLFGGVPLPLKPDRDASSYWVSRSEPAQPQDRFFKRY